MAFAEIDMDNGLLWDNLELSNQYREETRDFVAACLGLKSDLILDPVNSVNATVRGFEKLGTEIREAYSYGLSTPCF